MQIHSAASVHPDSVLGGDCQVGPFCVVEAGARLGACCVLEPFSRVCAGARLGDRVRVGQGAAVGGLAQVRSPASDGGCEVGDDARIGEYGTVHRSATAGGRTIVGAGAMVLAYAHVAHDCSVGPGAVLANGVQLGGHVQVGRGAFLGGGAHVHQFVRIGEFAFAAGRIRLDMDLAPWSRALGEPPRWAGLNRVALRREAEAPPVVAAEAALRLLFRSGLRLDRAIVELRGRGREEDLHLAEFAEGGRRGLLRPIL